eukprot:1067033_1
MLYRVELPKIFKSLCWFTTLVMLMEVMEQMLFKSCDDTIQLSSMACVPFTCYMIAILYRLHSYFGVFEFIQSGLLLLLLLSPTACTAQGSRPGCLQGVNYATALAHCNSNNLRLCSLDEINTQVGRGTGCLFDGYHLWTRTSCGPNQHWIAITGSSNGDNVQADKPPECTNDTATTGVSTLYYHNIAVQCCDVSPTGAPTKEPSTGPTGVPSTAPTASTDVPSTIPKTTPTGHPSTSPSKMPTHGPTNVPSTSPTDVPSTSPTRSPSANPTTTTSPTHIPSTSPSANPTTTTTLEPITTYSSDSDDADDMESVSWSDSGDINSAFLGHQQKDDDSLTNNADIPYKVEIDLSLTALCIVIAICVSITAIFWSYQCRGQKSKSSNASQNDVEVNN